MCINHDPGYCVRAARPDEAEAVLHVVCAAFALDPDVARSIFYEDPFFDLNYKRVLVAPDGEIVSCLTIIPCVLRIGAAVVPTAGIAGVATLPVHQRHGYAKSLLSVTIADLAAELHFPLSALFAYSYDYYRPLGWETASRVALWKAAPACLPQHSEACHIRSVNGAVDRERVQQIHAAATRERTGACLRDARRWDVAERLVPNWETAVYDDGCRIDGYVIWERRSDHVMRIQEMYGATDAARRGLIGFLARQGVETLEWPASLCDLAHFGLSASPVSVEPGVMLRITELSSALKMLHAMCFAPILADTNAALVIRATDEQSPQNERPLRVDASGVTFAPDETACGIAADIRVLAQLLLGYRMPRDAHAEGLLRASSADALALADRLFPARAPYFAPLDQF